MIEKIDLSVMQVGASYLFVMILLLIVRIKGLAREREILISTVRMTLQLILAGFVLEYLLKRNILILNIAVVAGMLAFSVFNIFRRVKEPLTPKIKKVTALSMFVGTSVSILYFQVIVLGLIPGSEARFFIPVCGMLIGNAMTGISLGVKSLVSGMRDQRRLIESALMLGATPKMAAKPVRDKALDAAFLPTINSMMGMGIVFLPGMMTGQILAGASPISAIAYQLAIMMGILGSVSLTIVLFLEISYRAYFNQQDQFIVPEQSI